MGDKVPRQKDCQNSIQVKKLGTGERVGQLSISRALCGAPFKHFTLRPVFPV